MMYLMYIKNLLLYHKIKEKIFFAFRIRDFGERRVGRRHHAVDLMLKLLVRWLALTFSRNQLNLFFFFFLSLPGLPRIH